MQGPPFQKEIHLPYSKWSQHRADNGLIYLAHPVTGEVKWLWSRHHDPKTDHDYLVNTITGKRQWVTKENAHFCPIKPNTQTNATNPQTKTSHTPKPNLSANSSQQLAAPDTRRSSSDTNPFANMPTAPARVATTPNQNSANHAKPKYREIAAPKSLGLTADEVLMLVPETGRRYIFNKKTKTSRWLPDRAPDTITDERQQKPLFGRSKASKQSSSRPKDDDDIHPALKRETQVPIMSAESHDSNSTNGMAVHVSSAEAVTEGGVDQTEAPVERGTQPSRQENVQTDGADETTVSRSGGEEDVEDEVDEISRRLGSLNTILADVSKMTTSDKYNMSKLRALSTENPSKEQAQAGSRRLLELEEYLTQQMLKVDAVESEGNQVIRAKRKETVKAILALTEEIERLREELSS